jgi:signal peptidase I
MKNKGGAQVISKEPNKVPNVAKGSKAKKSKKKNTTREYTEAIFVALLAAMFLRAFVVQAFRIPTGSMKDTLLVGDFLLVNKFIYGVRTPDRIPIIDASIPFFRLPAFKQPQNGDVVVFKYPKDEELDYIKRCVATPGQTVEIRGGELHIDGKPEGKPRAENFGPIEVPEGNYFMMGDNRDNSSDSRVWGFLPAENVVGEALVIYFSWDRMGPVWNLLDRIRWVRLANLIR